MSSILKEYQEFQPTTAVYPKDKEEIYLWFGLLSEVGEVCGKLKKEIRDNVPADYDDLIKEFGDIEWYLTGLYNLYDIDRQHVLQINMAKLKDRMNRNVIKGSGDDR